MQQITAKSTIGNTISISDGKMSNDFAMEEESKFLTKRFVPNWLVEVLSWINRIEMANSSLSTSSWTFKQLCWSKLHQNVKEHEISYMRFYPARYELGNVRALLKLKDEVIPIASIPPPNYIVGINVIEINFLDEQVVNFIKNIAHLLQNSLRFQKIPLIPSEMDKKLISLMHSLMKCFDNKIFKLIFNEQNLHDFNRLFPGIFDQVQSLEFWKPICDLDFTMKWLLKNQTNYGKQKFIEFDCPSQQFMVNFIDRIKEEFENSNSPSIFFIKFYIGNILPNFEEFTLENGQTNEILTSYPKMDSRGLHYFFLARYPKGEEHWKEVLEEKIQQIEDYSYISIKI